MDMRKICAWCRLELRAGDPAKVTYGICPKCADAVNQQVDAAQMARMRDQLDALHPLDPRD